MKKIGIDARFYSDQSTGIGKHVAELIESLGKIDSEHEYVIFLKSPFFENFKIPNARFSKRLCNIPHYSIAEQTKFLKQLNDEHLDLMVFPQFNVPLFYRKPFIVTIHDLTLHKFPGKKKKDLLSQFAYRLVIKNATHRARHCFAVSEYTKSDMVRYLKIKPEKITVAYNGVSPRFHPLTDQNLIQTTQKKYHLPPHYFLYLGVLRPHKNILGLLKGYSEALKASPLPPLVIAGPQEDIYLSEIKSLGKTLGLLGNPLKKDQIIFPGFLEERDINAILCGSRAFVFPSFYEGFGLPPLEAMQAGVPVGCSNTSSLPEVCGKAAYYFNPKRESEIAQAFIELHQNQSLRSHLIELGTLQCRHFSWERMAEIMLEKYRSILSESFIPLLNITLERLTKQGVEEKIETFIKSPLSHWAATPNAEMLLLSNKNKKFAQTIREADLLIPDGMSLLWAGEAQKSNWGILRSFGELIMLPFRKKYWKKTFPERISGADLYLDLAKKAEKEGWKIFLLGGQGNVPLLNKEALQKKFPRLKIVGFCEGSPAEKEDSFTQKIIRECGAQILFVAFGCPAQEYWIKRNLPALPLVKFAIGIGGSFDFLAQKRKRAPLFLQKLGFEWLWRLLQEPKRFPRILRAVIVFPIVFLLEKSKKPPLHP